MYYYSKIYPKAEKVKTTILFWVQFWGSGIREGPSQAVCAWPSWQQLGWLGWKIHLQGCFFPSWSLCGLALSPHGVSFGRVSSGTWESLNRGDLSRVRCFTGWLASSRVNAPGDLEKAPMHMTWPWGSAVSLLPHPIGPKQSQVQHRFQGRQSGLHVSMGSEFMTDFIYANVQNFAIKSSNQFPWNGCFPECTFSYNRNNMFFGIKLELNPVFLLSMWFSLFNMSEPHISYIKMWMKTFLRTGRKSENVPRVCNVIKKLANFSSLAPSLCFCLRWVVFPDKNDA